MDDHSVSSSISSVEKYSNFIGRIGIPGAALFWLLYELHTFFLTIVGNQIKIIGMLERLIAQK